MQGKKWRTTERERQVIDLYAQYHSVIKVAKLVDCGRSTIQSILKDNNIEQDGKRRRKKNPNSIEPKKPHGRMKYCPALITMLNRCMGYKAKKISEVTGYKVNGIQNVLSRNGLVSKYQGPSKNDYDLNQIEYEYVTLGISGRQLDKKYGLSEGTISDWMRQRGIRLGKGAHQEGRKGKSKSDGTFVYTERMKQINQDKHEEYEQRFVSRLLKYQNGKFEYVEGFRRDGKHVATIRCTKCGYQFEHSIHDISRKQWVCPECERIESEQRQYDIKEARRYERMFEEIREYALDKTCVGCGKVFHSTYSNQKYCCKQCYEKVRISRRVNKQRGYRHYYHVKYGDEYAKYFDPSVTLKNLYERDGGICQICGEPCDWQDRSWGTNGPMYPSLDHIIPRAKGGTHTWDNVQLTHCICNSYKRDLSNDHARELVMQDAKIAC